MSVYDQGYFKVNWLSTFLLRQMMLAI